MNKYVMHKDEIFRILSDVTDPIEMKKAIDIVLPKSLFKYSNPDELYIFHVLEIFPNHGDEDKISYGIIWKNAKDIILEFEDDESIMLWYKLNN